MNKQNLYPLTFKPLLKTIIWGGQDIRPFKGMEPNQDTIGESWEISHVDDNYSVVDNGELEGKNLDELIKIYGDDLVGKSVRARFGDKFPLLIKFIDARDNLSIQVHPNDELAKQRHNSFGKTEMWYVIKAAPDAKLFSGFAVQSSPEDYVKRIEENTIMDALAEYPVEAGDVFFLPAGRVHAIGAGCFIAEIQQTSNVTYRIYDYNRKDAGGNTRELHTELAKDAIDYHVEQDYRTSYTPRPNVPVELVECKYFETNLLDLTTPLARDFSKLDSFVIYICMEGEAEIKDNEGHSILIKQGHSILIPAITENVSITPLGSAKLLETFIPTATN
ncbi:type I phosphomannose isomerase catalytic subunit [Porphyromonas pogonae]|uniref:type I phosphomannose isomerase catalytic subunit n=1 Tax=Porphyromonas pogonae TaxID=867595 RepID=UPI002E7672F8|nr:type I phosphomannose isomerase catalytic subunit [Porphyromonas pogonae]